MRGFRREERRARGRRRTPLLWVSVWAAVCGFWDPVAKKAEEGNALFDQEAFAEALARYREAQTDRPGSPELHFNVGDALYMTGEYQEAAASFQQALQGAKRELAPAAWYNLGNAFFRKQEYEEAVKAYEKALELDADDVDAKVNLEVALERMKNPTPNPEGQSQNPDDRPEDPKDGGQGGQSPQDKQDPQKQNPQEGQDQEQPPRERKDQKQDPSKPDGQARQPGQLTAEEARRILEAMKDRETQAQKRRRVRIIGPGYEGEAW